NEWMDFDRLSFHEDRFEGLNTETMKRRGAIQQNGMVFNNFFQDVPHNGILPFYHLLRSLDCRAMSSLFKPVVDKRLEQLERHLLRQTALMQMQLRAHDNYRATRIVNAFSEQVLTETSLLPFQRIGKRLQWAIVCATQNAAAAAVIEQRVDGFL